MSSPSAGKRRMDTDVIKLYPLCSRNNICKQHPAFVSADCGKFIF